ncbi:MAG: amidohydrolase family protein [bacterium]|nr:amidohydrolase family protein [bacterium]MCY4258371.1 amidohydrolase family protein [bacterium]
MDPNNLILISVDDHIAEPADMFESHVPEKYKKYAPKVITDENGREKWVYGALPGRNLGLNAVAGKPRENYNVDASRYDEMRPGCYNVHERVRDMNAGGQLGSLNFPNWTGFSGQVLNEGPDPKINDIMIKAYNDWHVDEWAGAYPDRFIPCGILPVFDIDRAVAEVKRLANKGCHAITFSENPSMLGMPSIHSGAWDPLFATCSDLGTVLCCHLGSSSRSIDFSTDAPVSVGLTLSSILTTSTLVELVWADFWERFPNLRISLTEGDIGWIPYFLWRAEHVQERHSGWTKHDFGINSGPTDVFKKHILCCFINDRIGVKLLDEFNVDNLFWESDYPHSDGSWPKSPEAAAELFDGLPEETVAKITHLNAMHHYQFDPFAYRSPKKCTVAALRAESPDVDVRTYVGRPADERDTNLWKNMTTQHKQETQAPALSKSR